MLDFELIKPLEQAGISEIDAINFVGINAPVLREFVKDHPDWIALVLRLQKSSGPKDQSLLRVASQDPAVFWLVAHAADGQRDAVFAILNVMPVPISLPSCLNTAAIRSCLPRRSMRWLASITTPMLIQPSAKPRRSS